MTIDTLAVEGLKVSIYGDEGVARILDHISLSLAPGRILGIVGESGCGKSTLIRSILGILPGGAKVEAGAVMFEGENLLAFSEDELNTNVRGSRISPCRSTRRKGSSVSGARPAASVRGLWSGPPK